MDRRLGTAELFWWLDVDHRGRGIATRAVRLLAGWALDGLGLHRVTALVEPGNARSLAVAERAGFQREGVLRAAEPSSDGAGRIDLMVLSLLRTDPRC